MTERAAVPELEFLHGYTVEHYVDGIDVACDRCGHQIGFDYSLDLRQLARAAWLHSEHNCTG